MILLFGVIAGILLGTLRARFNHVPYQSLKIRHAWLVLVAFLPQFFAFSFPLTRKVLPDQWISVLLVATQILLLVFIWINRKIPGGWLMGLGLVLNFAVIILNGGMMPILPENAQYLLPEDSSLSFAPGDRLGGTKDILLEKEETSLWFLGDVFLLPKIADSSVAFSPGDVILCLGAFWLFWELGSPKYKLESVPV